MRKGRRKQSSPKVHRDENLHFRLCHVCLFLNEAEEDILKCERCQSEFLTAAEPARAGYTHPQESLEDDDMPLSDEEEEMLEDLGDVGDMIRDRMAARRRSAPVYGLSVRW